MSFTPLTSLTTSAEGVHVPRPTVACWPSSTVSNSQIGRSPPGAETTTRSAVPARNVCAIGSIGIFKRVYLVGERLRDCSPRYVGSVKSAVESELSTWLELRRNPEVTYSSWSAVGRTSVMVAWKSSTGVPDRTQRSRVAGPTMVVSVRNGGVWKAMPSAAGTGVQSQAGSAAHALPPGDRLVAGLAAGSRVKLESECVSGSVVCSRLSEPRYRVEICPGGGQFEKPAE